MTMLRTKLALSAVGLALLATPALAQRPHHPYSYQQLQNYAPNAYNGDVGTYPNGATRSGSAESVQSGAEFNLIR
jgi:hypothetical protein